MSRWWQREPAEPHYGAVLVLLILTFLVTATAPSTDWAFFLRVVLPGVTLVLALATTGLTPRLLRLSGIVVALAVLGALAALVFGDSHGDGAAFVVMALLTVATPPVVGYGVLRRPNVDVQSIFGAICVYILAGLFFAEVYGATGSLSGTDFFAGGVAATSNDYLYFSYVTLTTTGYGDLTAASDLGRTFAVVEALSGQLYLVTVLALLVSRYNPRRRQP